MYRFCLLDGLNGPKTSTATLSKAPSTGNGKSGALLVFLVLFHCTINTRLTPMFYIFKHARPPISLFQLLKSFVHSKMGTSNLVMYIGQNFLLHRLRNDKLRTIITIVTFLATIKMTQQTFLADIKTIAS